MKYSIINTGFEVYGHSITNYKKEKNGDHLMIQNIESENILIAMVSDGVSGRPCDWMASELTCNKSMEFFLNNQGLPIEDRIRNSIQSANECLLSVEGECLGLSSTLVLVIWKYESPEFHYVSIGDSRLYRIQRDILQCLTKDDVHKGRKLIIDNLGKRYIEASTLTNSIGRQNLKVHLKKGEFVKGDQLLLTTDGFYEARRFSFEKSISQLFDSSDLAVDFENLFHKWELSAKDDMTAIVIKKVEDF